ncbi:hypothetical protein E2C01_073395 [Portunus trituberculatus]|uniref:Uncharacterized protein n=1 Tax=Portunus trituberculatus TaxID=210409 RepID=A0A5B7I590_PORTR|nr:hypothetical protein [Portunus trituberculatus]
MGVRCACDGEREVPWVGLRDDRQQRVASTALLDVLPCSVTLSRRGHHTTAPSLSVPRGHAVHASTRQL